MSYLIAPGDKHLLSAQHRDLTRQSRRRTTADDSLMERFMQDVLDHHPDNYQDNRIQKILAFIMTFGLHSPPTAFVPPLLLVHSSDMDDGNLIDLSD
ncbi:hypothetical protein ACRRTK_000036 [Alexandromys fortis]